MALTSTTLTQSGHTLRDKKTDSGIFSVAKSDVFLVDATGDLAFIATAGLDLAVVERDVLLLLI